MTVYSKILNAPYLQHTLPRQWWTNMSRIGRILKYCVVLRDTSQSVYFLLHISWSFQALRNLRSSYTQCSCKLEFHLTWILLQYLQALILTYFCTWIFGFHNRQKTLRQVLFRWDFGTDFFNQNKNETSIKQHSAAICNVTTKYKW